MSEREDNVYKAKLAEQAERYDGFSSNVTPNPFGQSTFGKTATPAFGTQSTAFGSPATPLFGATSQHNSLFGTPTQTATFGQNVASQSAFGSGMFGNTTSQPSGSGLFGSANTSAFGQQNKTTAFGFGSNTGNTGFFGQSATQVQPAQQNTGLFGQTSTNLFGASAGFGSTTAGPQMGTVIKFTPVTGTDTMVKGSINQAISTRHHCITWKDYENKSLEELRWEDYQANRKGPQQGAQPSGGLFGNMSQPVGGGLFGAATTSTSTPGLFGQQDNKSVFGSSAPTPGSGFGQSSSGFGTATANTNTSGLFGNKSLTGFGANATTSSTFPFNSNTQTTHLFGPNTPAKPFGVTSQPNTLFGQPSTFGTQSTFGSFANTQNQVPTNVGLFNQNKTTPFNIGTSTPNTFGSFGQPAAQNTGSLFPSVKTTTGGFSGFGTTTTAPPFGQPSFGQNNQSLFNSSFNKPAQTLFGQPNTTNTLGMGLNMGTGTSLFSNTANKPNTMFGNNMGMFNSGFGNTANTSSFNLGGINTQPGVPNADQANANNEQQIISMSSTPYGLPGLLSNVLEVDNDLKDSTRPTNPGELNALLNTVNKSQSNTVSDKLQPVQVFGRKVPMFDGLEHRDETLISNIRINNNPKRLIIRYNNLNNKDLYDGDSLRVNSSWNMSLTENNSPVKKTLENITDKEQVIDEKRNDRSKNKLATSLFDAKNTSNVDINDSSLSSTVINLSAKNFESDAEEDKEKMAEKSVFQAPKKKPNTTVKTSNSNKPTKSLSNSQYEEIFATVIEESPVVSSTTDVSKSEKEKNNKRFSNQRCHDESGSTACTDDFSNLLFSSTPDQPGALEYVPKQTQTSKREPMVSDALKILELSFNETQLSQPGKTLSHRDKLQWLQDRRGGGLYVQCDDCNRWRYLKDTDDPVDLPKKWYCHMNPDKEANKCEISEERLSLFVEHDLIHNKYTAGTIVWAKLDGYPWWPAMVDDDPDTEQYYWLEEFSDFPTHYHVVFFHCHEISRAWILNRFLKSFKHYDPKQKISKAYVKEMAEAMKQAQDAITLNVKGRLKKYSFLTRWTGSINTPSSSDCEELLENPIRRKKKYAKRVKKTQIQRLKKKRT